jgi:hypothetical protein
MMELNIVESALLVLWTVGVALGLWAVARTGWNVRSLVAAAAAIFVPVLGSALAIAYAVIIYRTQYASELPTARN